MQITVNGMQKDAPAGRTTQNIFSYLENIVRYHFSIHFVFKWRYAERWRRSCLTCQGTNLPLHLQLKLLMTEILELCPILMRRDPNPFLWGESQKVRGKVENGEGWTQKRGRSSTLGWRGSPCCCLLLLETSPLYFIKGETHMKQENKPTVQCIFHKASLAAKATKQHTGKKCALAD